MTQPKTILPEVSYPTPDGVKTLLDDMAAQIAKAAAADPRSFVDLSLVRERDGWSGFT